MWSERLLVPPRAAHRLLQSQLVRYYFSVSLGGRVAEGAGGERGGGGGVDGEGREKRDQRNWWRRGWREEDPERLLGGWGWGEAAVDVICVVLTPDPREDASVLLTPLSVLW